MKAPLLLLASVLLMGCESLSYYGHVSQGQLSLLLGRQPVSELLANSETEPQLKQQLTTVTALREFAVQHLYLPDNDSYLSYQDIGRPYVAWNVFAAPSLDSKPKQWCFPVAGCVSYKGFFAEAKAQSYAEQLNREGYEVYIAPVPAYSTLGWFDDPVLNTFVYWPEWQLAALMFHELAHQQLYLKGDTAFSESFARAVEVEAVKQWLHSQGKTAMLASYLQHTAMRDAFAESLLVLRQSLQLVYQGKAGVEDKLRKKQALISQYQQQIYPEFVATWGIDAYRSWVMTELNNAKLVTMSSYYQWQPAFQQLFKQQQGDWQAFYRWSKAMAKQAKLQRTATLSELLKQTKL